MLSDILLQFDDSLRGIDLDWDLLVASAGRTDINLYLGGVRGAAATVCHDVDGVAAAAAAVLWRCCVGPEQGALHFKHHDADDADCHNGKWPSTLCRLGPKAHSKRHTALYTVTDSLLARGCPSHPGTLLAS